MDGKRDLRRERASYVEQVRRDVADRYSEFKMDSSVEPEELVAFFFRRPSQGVGVYIEDPGKLLSYISDVLRRRRSDLERAQSLHRAAACLNDLDAVAHHAALVAAIQTVIKTFEDLHKRVIDSYSPTVRSGTGAFIG
jgi:hypothetical protein